MSYTYSACAVPKPRRNKNKVADSAFIDNLPDWLIKAQYEVGGRRICAVRDRPSKSRVGAFAVKLIDFLDRRLQMLEAVIAAFDKNKFRLAFKVGDAFLIRNQLIAFLVQHHAFGRFSIQPILAVFQQ